MFDKLKKAAGEVWQTLEMLGSGLKGEIIGTIIIIMIFTIVLNYGSCSH